MKLELKENMYVRTKDGYISQYKYYDYDIGEGLIGKLLCIPLSNGTFANIEDIVKASYNIIEILEENDYVNGLRVEKNKYGELYTSYVYYGGDIGKQCEVYTTWLKKLEEDMIYSIVTHEQMEQMAYKVVE